jgi:hypothetical protein
LEKPLSNGTRIPHGAGRHAHRRHLRHAR